MKTSIDSYVKKQGTKCEISENVVVNSPYPFAAKLIEEFKTQSGEIDQMDFKQVDKASLIKLVAEQFPDADAPNEDAYLIEVKETSIQVHYETMAGAFYGANTIKRMIISKDLTQGYTYNNPHLPFRGLKIYIPSRDNIPFFYETIDLCGYLGYNKLVIEVGGAMEYKRHPEINEGWEEYSEIFTEYQGKSLDVMGSVPFHKNSIHSENGGGSYLTQDEVSQLISYCNERGIEVIPEVPCLSHCDYLLTRHPDLAERKEDPLPDTYCPSNPKSYELLFDVLEEVIEVFNPNIVHIGHDEYYSLKLCPLCKDKKGEDIFADDINKIYNFLKERNIKTMMWGEKLLTLHAKDGSPGGGLERDVGKGSFYIPEVYKARDLIPKDIIIMHWYWGVNKDTEVQLYDRGFPVVFGNFRASGMDDWQNRKKSGVEGVSISNWSGLNIGHMQRNHIFIELALTAMMVWNPNYDDTPEQYEHNLKYCSDLIYRFNNYKVLHSPHIEITHATTRRHEHKPFVDGYCIDFDGDYLGEYRLSYEDGSVDNVPVYYGLNIANIDVSWEIKRSNDPWSVSMEGDGHLAEPTYTCRLTKDGDKTFYTFPIPLKGELKSIKFYPKYDNDTVKWMEKDNDYLV